MTERLILVLDDDPTGIQTVHGVWVYYLWSAEVMHHLFTHDRLAFIQTNSRSLSELAAVRLTREIISLALDAARQTGRDFTVISRSDSSLRGHYPAEPDAIRAALDTAGAGPIDGTLLCFQLPEAGRLTVDNVHCIEYPDGRRVPVTETEFARDPTFGYRHADLTRYVEEKTGGRVPAASVASIPVDWLERGDVAACTGQLLCLSGGQPLVVNGTSYRHLQTLTQALTRAEAAGRRYVFRTAAAFVRAYGRIPDRALLSRAELNLGPPGPVLTIVGSHTQHTTRQLEPLLAHPQAAGIELSVPDLLTHPERVRRAVAERLTKAVAAGQHPVLMTSRQVQLRPGASPEEALTVARHVSQVLTQVVAEVSFRPRAVIAKGGITSSDVATRGLRMTQALILGALRPSIPVVRAGPESRFPGIPYVIFPGNTGQADDLYSIWQDLISP
jgi:uncharacterized protein YgbK (DUF1537 family)